MKFLKRLTVAALSLSLVAPPPTLCFTDVQAKDWFFPAVNFAVGRGLFNGLDPDHFAPQQMMSRAMFYTILARMAKIPVNDQQGTNLQDVPQGQWYTGSVIWALSSGLTTCSSPTHFGANNHIMRVELCEALARYDRYSGIRCLDTSQFATFDDLGRLNGEQRAAVAACQEAGIIQGKSDGRFDPYSGTTRVEVAQIFRNYCTLAGLEMAPTGNASLWLQGEGWSGSVQTDFPLGSAELVTPQMVESLNRKILYENLPAEIAPLGTTLDGNEKHLTNYGPNGQADCIDVRTNHLNKNNEIDTGVALNGRQEYYGYALQTSGVVRQDRWHSEAESSGKDPWQCTWWVWGRAAQYIEASKGQNFQMLCEGRSYFGHGKNYYNELENYFVSDMNPSANSVVSWTCGTYGHVAYVEAVDEDGIWVSMADSGHTWRGITYIEKSDDPDCPYPLHWYEEEKLNGFNHLDQPKKTQTFPGGAVSEEATLKSFLESP